MHLPRQGNNSTLTSSFLVQPQSVTFNEQQDDEQLYLLIRRHQITNIPWLVGFFVALFVPLVAQGFADAFIPSVSEALDPFMRFCLFVFWYLGVFAYAFEQFLLWFFTVNIVTNDRIVDIDFRGLFTKDFSEAQLTKVQDVRSQISGPLQLTFNYGTVFVQTAAEITHIEFDNIPMPDQVSKLVGELVGAVGGTVSRHES
jgi:hypothetical protein